MAESEDPAELVARLEQALERIAAQAQRGPASSTGRGLVDRDLGERGDVGASSGVTGDLAEVTTRLDALIARLRTALASHMQE